MKRRPSQFALAAATLVPGFVIACAVIGLLRWWMFRSITP